MTDRPTTDPTNPADPGAAPAGPATVAEPGTELVLVPPAPVAAVSPTQATTVVPVDPAVARQLEATADAFADSVAALDAHSPTFTGKVGSITRMGDREMRDAAAVSNRMLERPVKAMGSGLFDAGSPVSKSLIDLRNTVEELDPKVGMRVDCRRRGVAPSPSVRRSTSSRVAPRSRSRARSPKSAAWSTSRPASSVVPSSALTTVRPSNHVDQLGSRWPRIRMR